MMYVIVYTMMFSFDDLLLFLFIFTFLLRKCVANTNKINDSSHEDYQKAYMIKLKFS